MGVVVLLEPFCVLLGGIRESACRDDHPALRAGEVERRDGQMQLLDDWPADSPGVLTLDDDLSPSAVNDVFHDDVPALVGSFLGLPNVLVAEVSEYVLHQVLEFGP